jgi:hypothetical protein
MSSSAKEPTESLQVTLDPFSIPGYVSTKSLEEVERRHKTLTHISLFTGIGGFDLGFAEAGIESRVMVELLVNAVLHLEQTGIGKSLRKESTMSSLTTKPLRLVFQFGRPKRK